MKNTRFKILSLVSGAAGALFILFGFCLYCILCFGGSREEYSLDKWGTIVSGALFLVTVAGYFILLKAGKIESSEKKKILFVSGVLFVVAFVVAYVAAALIMK